MAAPVSNIYAVLEGITDQVEELAEQDKVSPLLIWLLLRQQAEYQLLLLQNPID